MTDEQINDLIEKTLAFEGGYVNDPDDPGGATKFGISQRAFPGLDIPSLTKEQAIQIYREKYWKPVNEFIPTPDGRVLWKLFDIAVNQGVATAEAFWSKVGYYTPERALHELSALQMKRYALIIKAKPHLAKYLSGWVNRAMEIG